MGAEHAGGGADGVGLAARMANSKASGERAVLRHKHMRKAS
jgi:hypothetical protein